MPRGDRVRQAAAVAAVPASASTDQTAAPVPRRDYVLGDVAGHDIAGIHSFLLGGRLAVQCRTTVPFALESGRGGYASSLLFLLISPRVS